MPDDMTPAHDFAATLIARTASMSGRDHMRRCIRTHAKAMIAIIDAERAARAKGFCVKPITVADVRARVVDACENAATWAMTANGRTELELLVRD